MSHPRRIGAAALAVAAVTLTVALPAQAATFNPSGGSAYATTASVGTLVNLGKTSYVPLCTTKTPDSVSNNTAAVNLGGLLGTVGAATTTVSTAQAVSVAASPVPKNADACRLRTTSSPTTGASSAASAPRPSAASSAYTASAGTLRPNGPASARPGA